MAILIYRRRPKCTACATKDEEEEANREQWIEHVKNVHPTLSPITEISQEDPEQVDTVAAITKVIRKQLRQTDPKQAMCNTLSEFVDVAISLVNGIS